jgi:hypothetical protein
MSTDWNIKCVDCDEIHHFDDANHQDDRMLLLIKHADAIAALAELSTELGDQLNFRLGYSGCYGSIDPAWFRKHLGHNLMPIDEYGRMLDQCREHVYCGECKTRHRCGLKLNHEGEHKRVP